MCRRVRQSEALHTDDTIVPIQQLYAVEKEGRELDAPARAALRREKSVPVLGQIRQWLDEQQRNPGMLPRSPIGQAIGYALNQWPALCVYPTDGRLSIDNDVSERALRRVAVGRKNRLFAGHDESGQHHAVLWSLIASAERHEIDVQLYLRSVLAYLPVIKMSELELYLPDRWKRDLTPAMRIAPVRPATCRDEAKESLANRRPPDAIIWPKERSQIRLGASKQRLSPRQAPTGSKEAPQAHVPWQPNKNFPIF